MVECDKYLRPTGRSAASCYVLMRLFEAPLEADTHDL